MAEVYLGLGYYYYYCEQDYKKALEMFSNGLVIHSNNSDLYNAVAAILRRMEKLEESRDNFLHAYKLDPRSHLKLFDIAVTYGMMRQYDSADYYVNKSITLGPDFSLAHLYCAWMPIIKNGDIVEAERRLVKASKRTNLKSSKYYWWLLRTLKLEDEPMLNQFTPHSDSIAYFLYVTQSHRLNKNYDLEKIYGDSLFNLLESKIKSNPNDARFNVAMGLAQAALRNRDQALQFGGIAAELAKTYKEPLDAPFIVMDYVEILMIFEMYDEAIGYIEYLLSIPGFVSPAYFEADPLWKELFENEKFIEMINKSSVN